MQADAGCGLRERKAECMRGLTAIEMKQSGCRRRNAERRGKIGRPDATPRNDRAVDRKPKPDHRFIARNHRGIKRCRIGIGP